MTTQAHTPGGQYHPRDPRKGRYAGVIATTSSIGPADGHAAGARTGRWRGRLALRGA